MKKARNIGVTVTQPKEICKDTKCPFHGSLSVRGRTFEGKATLTKMPRTITVEFYRQLYVPKYERYEKKRTILKAHLPDCIKVSNNSTVKVMETRKLSKTKHFVVVAVENEGNKS